MPHSQSFNTIVLKTYDVGEADRLCVLFTRERGRIAARASGARRLQSRLGPSLLPFRHLTVELKEGSAGWVVAGAATERVQGFQRFQGPDVPQFVMLEEGIELLLRLVTDEGALPEVFDVTLAFLAACHQDIPHASLGYSFALLHCLGFLPEEQEMANFGALRSADHAYLEECRCGRVPAPGRSDTERLQRLKTSLLEAHITAPLRSGRVLEAMR